MKTLRKTWLKRIAVFTLISMLTQLVVPTLSWALTGGPDQPEVHGFSPVTSTEMVNPFTGDFSYNIPLLDVEGYPVNLSYNSGVKMDEESSWVGLGWSLTPGAITRNLRGLPDDFNGDQRIQKNVYRKPNITYAGQVKFKPEGFGASTGDGSSGSGDSGGNNTGGGGFPASFGIGVKYNNYAGISFSTSVSPQLTVHESEKADYSVGLTKTNDSQNGLSLSPNVSVSKHMKEDPKSVQYKPSASVGMVYNSQAGLTGMYAAASFDRRSETKGEYKGKERYRKNSFGPSGSISFGMPTFTPSGQLPYSSTSGTFEIGFGATVFGVKGTFNLMGAKSLQTLRQNYFSYKAYGYMHSEKVANKSRKNTANVLMDFNREKDGSFSKNTPNLPVTNFTYDLFSISGHGVGGQFRSYRNDIGHVSDPYVKTSSGDFSTGFSLGAGNSAYLDFDGSYADVTTESGRWEKRNMMLPYAKFSRSTDKRIDNDISLEPSYLAMPGEMVANTDPDFVEGIVGDVATEAKLGNEITFNVPLKNKLNPYITNGPSIRPKRIERRNRNTTISKLTVKQADIFGVRPDLFYRESEEKCIDCIEVTKENEDQIGEITVIQPGGARYVYGLPVYNLEKKEITFASGRKKTDDGWESELQPDEDTKLLNYADETGLQQVLEADYSEAGKLLSNGIAQRGIDHYFENSSTPGYAHSFLITAVLSANYVDSDGIAGPSPGDQGNYTLFHYDKMDKQSYQWRQPYEAFSAHHQEGKHSDEMDDRGHFTYGKKDIWYLKSIESKNQIAKFYRDKRWDGMGVKDIHGGRPNSTDNQWDKLYRIALYSKEKVNKYTNEYEEKLLKTVTFLYDYRLCNGVPNSSKHDLYEKGQEKDNITGKLTLKGLYFTYGDSQRGKQSPYIFKYKGHNHDYEHNTYDRWGNYKPKDEQAILPFPYVRQLEEGKEEEILAEATDNVAPWDLTDITTPSGAKIHVDYESDDYAYVQDRRAMQMIKVKGLTTGPSFDDDFPNMLFERSNGITKPEMHNYLHIELPYAPSEGDHLQRKLDFGKRYLNLGGKGEIKNNNFLFRIFTNMASSGGDEEYELVPGFCSLLDYDVYEDEDEPGKWCAWLRLKPAQMGDGNNAAEVNPIAKAAWQYARLHRFEVAFDQPSIGNASLENVARSIVKALPTGSTRKILTNVNRKLMNQNKCRAINPKESYVRLYNPIKRKLGGGSRVKRIIVSDEADEMHPDIEESQNAYYGVEYSYTLEDGTSSGVAAYEPFVGNDENPWVRPIAFGNKQEKILAPDDRNYMLTPMGESFFPAPVVGYSQVIKKSIGAWDNETEAPLNLLGKVYERHKVGHEVLNFYTAKDYPTRVDETTLEPSNPRTSPAIDLLNIAIENHMFVSQGYSIELNDMHGKLKSSASYDAQNPDKLLASTEYKYRERGTKKIGNKVRAVAADGTWSTRDIGVEYDFVQDFRSRRYLMKTIEVHGNLASFMASVIPAVIPVIIPAGSLEKNSLQTAVTTKVVHRFGVLEEVVSRNLNSSLTTRNEAWDAVTGQVLSQSIEDEFGNKVYTATIPAHWVNKGMGQAAQNVGFRFKGDFEEIEGGYHICQLTPEMAANFSGGEEVRILINEDIGSSTDRDYRFWVIKNPEWAGCEDCIELRGGQSEEHGRDVVGKTSFEVIRSGFRNMQGVSLSSFVTAEPLFTNPEGDSGDWSLGISSHKVLSHEVVAEYKDEWLPQCWNNPFPYDLETLKKSPYHFGLLGNYRLYKTHAFKTDRVNPTSTSSLVKTGGYYKDYQPFFEYDDESGLWRRVHHTERWVNTTTIPMYHIISGAPLQSENALNIPAAAIYNFNRARTAAQSANVEAGDMLFDSFEEHEYQALEKEPYRFNGYEADTDIEYARDASHSGRTALKVKGGKKAFIELNKPCEREE